MQTLLGLSVLICIRLQMAQSFATSNDYVLHRSGGFADSANVVQQHHDHHRTSHIRPSHSYRHQQHFEIEKTEGAAELPTLILSGDATQSSYSDHVHQHKSKQQRTKSRLQLELINRLSHVSHNDHQRRDQNAVHAHKQYNIVAKSRAADHNTTTTGESETTAGAMILVKPTSHPTHVTTKSAHTITLNEPNKRTQNYYHQPIVRPQYRQQLRHIHQEKQPNSDSSETKFTSPSVNGILLNLPAKSANFTTSVTAHVAERFFDSLKHKSTDGDATATMQEHSVLVGGSSEHIAGTTSKSDSGFTAAGVSIARAAEYADDEVEYYDYSSDDESNANQHALATVDTDYIYNSGIDGDNAEWHMPALNYLGTNHQHSRHYQEEPQPQRRQQGQQHQQPHVDGGEHSRVARDHHRMESHQFHNNHVAYDTHSYDEYADDEPYRESSKFGLVTDQKLREVGTMAAVQRSRDLYMQSHKSPSELATEHMNRMRGAARCSRPLPRVIHVSKDTSKTYVPSCTILYRCGEDTGCCRSKGQVCNASLYEMVPLHFIVIQDISNNSRGHSEIKIEKLQNDTTCHCINRTDLTSDPEVNTRDKRSGSAVSRRSLSTLDALNPQNELGDRSGLEDKNETDADAVCHCPRHFNVFQEDIRWQSALRRHEVNAHHTRTLNCRCDCADTNAPCLRFKNGEEGFAVEDRRCIADRTCIVPNCSFGIYNEQIGKCPRPSRKHKRHNNGFG